MNTPSRSVITVLIQRAEDEGLLLVILTLRELEHHRLEVRDEDRGGARVHQGTRPRR